MLLLVLQFRTIYAAHSCNENNCPTFAVISSQRQDKECSMDCNSGICGFDQVLATLSPFTSPCISECYSTLCDEILSTNDQCDESCNNSSCGFDWGKCGFCASGCNI